VTRSVALPDTFVEFRVFPLESGLGVSLRNITEAREAEAALREGHTRYEIAANAAGLGVWDWDLLSGQMLYSESAKAIHGFPPHAPVTIDQVRAATHKADYPHTSAQAQRALDPAIRDPSPYVYRSSDRATARSAGSGRTARRSSPGGRTAPSRRRAT
jgi:PAS domain-containing protein